MKPTYRWTLLLLSLTMGCQTADLKSFSLKSPPFGSKSANTDLTEEEIQENSRRFVENVKKEAATQADEAEASIKLGQQEIIAWYQDKDDRHIKTARTHFQKSLNMQPTKNVEAHHGLAVVADLEEDFKEAEKQYQFALAHAPSNSKILGNLGYSYLLQKRLAESERYLLRATQIDATNTDAVKHLGDVYLAQGRPGEAQATYSKIMNSEAARQLVSEQSQTTPSEQEQSLLGKLRPGQIQQAGAEVDTNRPSIQELRQRAEMGRIQQPLRSEVSGLPSIRPETQYSAHAQYNAEQRLKDELAAIDRERYQNHQGSAISMNTATGAINRHSPGSHSMRNQHVQNFQTPTHHRQNDHNSGNPRQGTAVFIGGEGNISNQPNLHHMTHGQPLQLPQISANQSGSSGNDAQQHPVQNRFQSRQNLQSQHQPQQPPASDPLLRPWNGTPTSNPQQRAQSNSAQQVGYHPQLDAATQSQDHRTLDHRTLDHRTLAYEVPTSDQTERSSARPAQVFSGRQSPNVESVRQQQPIQQFNNPPRRQPVQDQTNASTQRNAFEEASLEAARMGMGLGPGSMFPTINQTAPQQQPGANSHWNGSSYSQPNRILPSEMAPVDLQQAFDRPTVNSMGQQLPGSEVTNTPDQFGTASRYEMHIQQLGNESPGIQQHLLQQQREQQLQMEQQLAAQRNPANEQLNQQMQEAWNQRRMSLHTPTPNAPALRSPAEHGGMLPYGSTMSPPSTQHLHSQFPVQNRVQHVQGKQHRSPQQFGDEQKQFSASPSSANDRRQNPGHRNQQNVVEPPPYRPGYPSSQQVIQSGYSTSTLQQQNPTINRTNPPQHASYGNLPTIRPGTP